MGSQIPDMGSQMALRYSLAWIRDPSTVPPGKKLDCIEADLAPIFVAAGVSELQDGDSPLSGSYSTSNWHSRRGEEASRKDRQIPAAN